MLTSVVLLAFTVICVQSQTALVLPPLPYAYSALEPVLSEHLMRLHHDKHFDTYTKKTNEALKTIMVDTSANEQLKELAKKPLEEILHDVLHLPEQYQFALRHNGGGYYNHKLFFSMLKAPTATAAENKPTGALLEAIEKSFGSFDKFRELFSAASVNLFGSGWVWLYIDAQTHKLVLNFTANQDNPIMFDKNHVVLLGIDVWEHAYYPVYENRRSEYIDNFWRIVNWPFVAQLYTEGTTKRADL
ncbi:unnamed protein product [Adineta ricciae]|uniref:Superoxide dismutase n=1 Tax=Adineta ricciae TaxID=249248 RepID=A0A815AL60_ADIRI|nr:unnamed protein product [Adineta ricciae]CAF1258963.1 unnamed protein product [Adineta ricciae]